MKLGMPALIEMKSIEENVQLAKKLDLDFVELNLDLPYCDINKNNLKELSQKYDIEFTIHLSEKVDIAEPNDNLRIFYLQEIEKIISIGKENNIKKYNLHLDPGIHFSLPDKKVFIYEQYIEEYKNNLKKSCEFLNQLAKKYNVEIFFENLKLPNYLREGFKIIASYDNLFFTLDIGHDAKSGNKTQAFFEEFPNKIKHVHLHDYDGNKDHLTLGMGILDIKEKLNLVNKYSAYAVIEIKREQELIDSIKYIKSQFN